MPAAEPRRSPEEIARLGSEAFERHVRPALRPQDDGKFVAIDIESGEYELDEDDYAAVMRLRARLPSAEVWLGRVGQPAAYRMRQVDELRPEYDFLSLCGVVRGKYATRYWERLRVVGLADDVAGAFADEAAVNAALRDYLRGRSTGGTPTEPV